MLKLESITAEVLRSFGALVLPPETAGVRNVYTEWLGNSRDGMTPRLHTNRVIPSTVPFEVTLLERHPFSAQIFLPLNVARYVIVVAPSLPDGSPDLGGLRAFVAPGDVGVVYAAGVWHAGATVLDQPGSFAVLMGRNDTSDDEEFLLLESPILVLS